MRVFNGYMQNCGKRQTPEHLVFRSGMTHLNYSLKKLGKFYKLQKELMKTEMNHDETDYTNYKEKKMNG